MSSSIQFAPGSGQGALFGEAQVTHFVIKTPPWPGRDWLNRFLFPVLLNLSKGTGPVGVTSAAFVSPDELAAADAGGKLWFQIPPEYRTGRSRPWAVIVQWKARAQTGTTADFLPLPIALALLGGVLLGVLGAAVFTPFTRSVKELGETAKGTIFNPGFVLAALVGIALIMRGKR